MSIVPAHCHFAAKPESLASESYRFNGSGPYSIRHNASHRLNTNTNEVMERNNPFLSLSRESGNAHRSFEKYIMEDNTDTTGDEPENTQL
jgi:hypothetical protein